VAKTFETVYATSMTITASLFESFLKCPTKCWLRAAGEAPSGNTYAAWVTAQNESYRATETERLLAATLPGESDRSPLAEDCKTAKWRLAMEVTARTPEQPCRSRREEANSSLPKPSALNQQPSTNNEPTSQSLVTSAPTGQPTVPPSVFVAETHLHAVERVPSEGRGKAAQFIPIRFIFRNKLTRDDKLLLAFDAFVLSAALGREITSGFMGEVLKSARADGALWLLVLAFCVAAPISEELFARGFLYRGWSESFLKPAGAILLSSLAWTVLHIQYDLFFLGEVFSIGVLFGYLRYRTGSLWLTILLHGLNNLAATLQTILLTG